MLNATDGEHKRRLDRVIACTAQKMKLPRHKVESAACVGYVVACKQWRPERYTGTRPQEALLARAVNATIDELRKGREIIRACPRTRERFRSRELPYGVADSRDAIQNIINRDYLQSLLGGLTHSDRCLFLLHHRCRWTLLRIANAIHWPERGQVTDSALCLHTKRIIHQLRQIGQTRPGGGL